VDSPDYWLHPLQIDSHWDLQTSLFPALAIDVQGSFFQRYILKGGEPMVRKTFIIFLMAPLLVAALATGTSFPVLLLMVSLLLVALFTPSVRDEPEG